LSAGLDAAHVHFIDETNAGNKEVIVKNNVHEYVTSTECLGSAAEPTAEPGNLCVYTQFVSPAPPATEPFNAGIYSPAAPINPIAGAGATGAIVAVETSGGGTGGAGSGTWAVTAL
jgi:hypothetical protein